jgi:hypothetical protein
MEGGVEKGITMAVARDRSVFLLKHPNHSGVKIGVLVATLAVAALVVSGCLHGFGESAERYYPLKQGMKWKYRLTVTELLFPFSGEERVANLPPRSLAGRQLTPQMDDVSLGAILGTTLPKQLVVEFYGDDGTGIREFASQRDADPEPKPETNYLIKYPIRVGTRWTEQHKTQLVKKDIDVAVVNLIKSTTDQVVVPAGPFINCIRIKASGKTTPDSSGTVVSIDEDYWLAPDVGMVKSIYTEKASDSTREASVVRELEEFKH